MNIAELEAALKARIDACEKRISFKPNNGIKQHACYDEINSGLRLEINCYKEALTLISQLKQSVEAKRDKDTIKDSASQYWLGWRAGEKKLIDEIIGLSEERKDGIGCADATKKMTRKPSDESSTRKSSVETFDDGLTRTFSDVSRCPACSAMTHTVSHPKFNTSKAWCGKCGAVKP